MVDHPTEDEGNFTRFRFYLDLAKFILGLAAGSIVLLVGSSAFHSNGRLPEAFASPLFLLGLSIVYGILFMLFLVFNYEHLPSRGWFSSYTRFRYARNQALGFGSLSCFCVGYAWLILTVTMPPRPGKQFAEPRVPSMRMTTSRASGLSPTAGLLRTEGILSPLKTIAAVG